jgi:predicted glycosyltransferase
MNREAAALGVPAASIYFGEWAAVDEELLQAGRLQRLADHADLEKLQLVKKTGGPARSGVSVRREVAELILDS